MAEVHEQEIDAGPDLEPCPFCREDPYVHRPAFKGDGWQIGCQCLNEEDEERGAIWTNGKTFVEAAERWNERGSKLTVEERRAAVRGLVLAALRGLEGGPRDVDEMIERLSEVIVP